MNKAFKNPLFTFILGAITFSGIGIAFAYSLVANDVGYTPSDTVWEIDNISDALDDLKEISELDYVYGEQSSSSYGNWINVDVGFKPRMLSIIITTSGSYLRAAMLINGKAWTGYQKGYALAANSQSDNIKLTNTGFQWYVFDSSWKTHTIRYYAFK